MPSQPILTKSKLMSGVQCDKNLYLLVHKPKLARPVTPSEQARFDEGHVVGSEAQKRYPNGVLIEAKPWDYTGSVQKTERALTSGAHTLYEASFLHEGFYARVDILNRDEGAKQWDLIEVKSSTSLKDEHVYDTAIQAWIARGAGLKIRSYTVMHINNQCVYPDLSNLFTRVDITDRVLALQDEIEERILALRETVSGKDEPETKIGPHCDDPYECRYKHLCWKDVPSPSVFDLPSIGPKSWELYEDGIVTLDDPRLPMLEGAQKRMIEAFRTGRRLVDTKAIAAEIGAWQFPLYFLDFETIGFAVPRFDGTRPYQQVPFQFSLHAIASRDAEPRHTEFLHTDSTDPRRAVAEALVRAFGAKGHIVAYNKSFEGKVIEALAGQFADLAAKLRAIAARLVDPLPIFRNYVYDNGFMGSFSIKTVAPSILGDQLDYSKLLVQDGEMAQHAFLELAFSGGSDSRRAELIDGLKTYCRQDTLATVLLVQWLFSEAGL
ncbi:MAG TPA: DUF2779 domain-containing protein [Bdellovibrionales bacterium]|nr:DUF2779 domain-containing protein [Bdellovibrionales bacterium]